MKLIRLVDHATFKAPVSLLRKNHSHMTVYYADNGYRNDIVYIFLLFMRIKMELFRISSKNISVSTLSRSMTSTHGNRTALAVYMPIEDYIKLRKAKKIMDITN